MKNENICAVVVTYNRKNLLIECLDALQKQTRPIQGIYLIDNASTDGTPQLLLDKRYIRELPPENLSEPWEKEFEISDLTDGKFIKLHYVRIHKNTGSAGGFYEGVKRGYEKGYDWLWLMDDDGKPENNCLEELLKCGVKKNLDVLGSIVIESDNGELTWKLRQIDQNGNIIPRKYFSFHHEVKSQAVDGVYNGYPNFFNSILIKGNLISIVGFPEKKLFIWGDEVEYVLRFRRKGIAMGVCIDSIFKHPKPSSRKPDKLKYYYMFRNTYYIYRFYSDILYPNHLIRFAYPLYIFFKYIKLVPSKKIPFLLKILRGIFYAFFFKKLIPN